ncbi:MAG: substrate-binding domain-containing protein, partial [Acidimicrobiia bacterium]|nr:substrate-binding domain-containing protein [Acidimicrobiia bacterium]
RAFLESGVTLPSAIFAHNDLIAVGALAALREASLSVPDDVSLVGYNDLPMVGHLAPPLTTVVYRSFDVGAAAGDMVTRLLAGEDVEPISLAPTLAVRMSTRPV